MDWSSSIIISVLRAANFVAVYRNILYKLTVCIWQLFWNQAIACTVYGQIFRNSS